MISSLAGKALRTFLESRGLPSDSTCVLKAEPDKLDTWYSIEHITYILAYAISTISDQLAHMLVKFLSNHIMSFKL